MLRRRLTVALTLLAFSVALEGVGAVVALQAAERHLERGRMASDIQRGFVELSATKQRLRAWVAQFQQGAGADVAERERLQVAMRQQMDMLHQLAALSAAQDGSAAGVAGHVLRQDALLALQAGVAALEEAVDAAAPLTPGADARRAWLAQSELFDQPRGRDPRQVIASSIEREAAAVARERAATDRTLAGMRALWAAV